MNTLGTEVDLPVEGPPGPTLVYVVGPGRGGSTLFERTLNSSPRAFALGEFHCLWRLPVARLLCACGHPFERCRFWTEVMARSAVTASDLARLRTLEWRVARSGYLLRHRRSLHRLARQTEVMEYHALQRRLFAAIAAISGADHLVDTSKAGPRAWIMAAAPSTAVVHLRRSAVEVLASWRQPKWNPALDGPMRKPSVAAAAADWLKAAAWAASLSGVGRLQRIDYAELVQTPRAILEQALARLTPQLAGTIAWLDEHRVQPAAEYHSLNGNPNRFDTGLITIRPHAPAMDRLGTAERWAVRCVGGALDRIAP